MSVRPWWSVWCDFRDCGCRTQGEPTRALAIAQARTFGWLPPSRRTSLGGSRITTGWICPGHTGSDFIDPHRACESGPEPIRAVDAGSRPDAGKGRYYPDMPPALPGETNDAYTDRMTGADGTGRVPYDHRRYRQCSIGYHDECSRNRRPGDCECPCHIEPAP